MVYVPFLFQFLTCYLIFNCATNQTANVVRSSCFGAKKRVFPQASPSSKSKFDSVCACVNRELYGKVTDLELLVLLRFGTFPFEKRAICGVTSGQRSMERSAFSVFQKHRRDNDFE